LTSERLTGTPHTIDHIVPKAAGGTDAESNLWLACRTCNEFKGVTTHARDPRTGKVVPLFNPRSQLWQQHFRWSNDGCRIIGVTPQGRATVEALQLNHVLIVEARRRWVMAQWHPPEEG
jgi:5-methylcytosine-specific restriction endonuclease McrA